MKEIQYSTDRHSDAYVTVNNCGEQLLNKRDYDTVRENGRLDYGLQFIASGCGYYEDHGRIKTVEAGSMILHFPGVRQHYFFHKEDETHLMWVHFSGKVCEQLEVLRSAETVKLHANAPKEFRRTLDNMVRAYNQREPYYQTTCEGYLMVLIAQILQSASWDARVNALRHDGMTQVLEEMNVNFSEPICLERYAEMCFVSKSRFLHLFKTHMGVSPYHFQLQIRVERAKELLTYSALSVQECAQAVGYSDCAYFCRVFKKFTGFTPMHFRK